MVSSDYSSIAPKKLGSFGELVALMNKATTPSKRDLACTLAEELEMTQTAARIDSLKGINYRKNIDDYSI